ncbi:hypothetical protein QZH41_018315 [Actinostola sp. cb2023]|nr:hypothetical protein QZH41_018315 [Actinostola sp. cb2023]
MTLCATFNSPTGLGNSNFIGAGRYKPDQLTENFEDKSSSGCVLLLYSSILSRTIKRVISDMDDPNNKLMGAHGYCTQVGTGIKGPQILPIVTRYLYSYLVKILVSLLLSQEMVNLITTGRATSNAFDYTIELDSGGPNVVLLKGLERQSEVGLLSLFEHYGSCQVGEYYKTPKYPIWVICSESHFSVMFSTERLLLENWERKKKFDVYYYDGLSRQDEEIRLTIGMYKRKQMLQCIVFPNMKSYHLALYLTDTSLECADSQDGDLIPPLEHVIRTRWE